MEERSVWRGASLQTLAWNYRYFLDDEPKRQQWDVYRRDPNGLAAWRIQGPGETLEQRHPGFGRFWSIEAFGKPWLDIHARAAPTRRPDLDQADNPPPLAELFHWSAVAPRARDHVLLPGFKRDKVADLTVSGTDVRHADIDHPLLTGAQAGIDAVYAEGRLAHATFHGEAAIGSVRGRIDLLGCDPPAP